MPFIFIVCRIDVESGTSWRRSPSQRRIIRISSVCAMLMR